MSHRNRRSRRIRIGAQTWTIQFVRRGHPLLENDAEEIDVDGRTYTRRCLIAIADDLRGGALEDTILHEVLHAVLHVSGASRAMAEDVEETLVRALTPILHGLLGVRRLARCR